jgi:archaellum component FlaF (FlaF/FlaG flagellin family)
MRLLLVAGFLGSIALSGNVFGQYEKVYYNDTTFETDNYKVEIDNIVAVAKELKFRMNITNKTNDWVLYIPEQGKFEVGGKALDFKEESLLIPPFESKKRVLRATGSGLNDARSFNFVCEGFYKVRLKDPLKAPEFKLPASLNEFTVENFKVTLVNSTKTSAKTEVKYSVTYLGDGYGFISPAKIATRLPDGNVYITSKSKADVFGIKKGETETFTASWSKMEGGSKNDMQMIEMWVLFVGVFQESTQVKIDKAVIPLRWNDALTIGKK